MVDVLFDLKFKKNLKKIKDVSTKNKIIKQISKLKKHPELGKPMRYGHKGTRELYISPYRLSYLIKNDKIYLLDLYHKNLQ